MDSSIHWVQKVTVSSTELGGNLGMSTRIIVSSCYQGKEVEEEITLFSKDKVIENFNGKAVEHEKG